MTFLKKKIGLDLFLVLWHQVVKGLTMFKCGICGGMSEKKEKAAHVVMEKRKKVYPSGSIGWEIQREVLAHAKCEKNHVA